MLRITSKNVGQETVLHLEGKICRQWVGELCSHIHTALAEGGRIILDLDKVSYIDDEAVKMLSKFSPEQMDKRNCSLYIRTLLGLDEGRL